MKSAPSRFRGRMSLGALGVFSLLGAVYFSFVPVANVTVATAALLTASFSSFMYMVNEMLTPQEDQLQDVIFILKLSLAAMIIGGLFTWFDSLGYSELFHPLVVLIALVELIIAIALIICSAVNASIYFQDKSPGE